MKARSFFPRLMAGVALLVLVAVGSPRSVKAAPVGFAAGGLTAAGTYPVGSPTGTNPAIANNGISTLGIGTPFNSTIFDNYMAAGSCPWLAPALGAEGYGNNWTIVYQTLPVAAISLNYYAPYVNAKPTITQGGFNQTGYAVQGYGGAGIALGYSPTAAAITAGDPNPATTKLNWIQVVGTNTPNAFATGNAHGFSVGGGLTASLDNGYLGYFSTPRTANGPLPNNPFYGGLNNGARAGAANASTFIDRPSRALPTSLNNPVNWQAQVFLASWSPNVAPGNSNSNNAAAVIAGGGTITVYDGVWWGFQLTAVPEPSTYALMISAALSGMIAWSYRTLQRHRSGCSSSSSSCVA